MSASSKSMEESQQPARGKSPGRQSLSIWEATQWTQMRHALAQHHCIVCFDAEWEYQLPNRVTELGVAIMRDGLIMAHNVRVRGRGRRFHGGETVYMDDDAAKTWLRDIMAAADLLVGHALQNDRLKMKRWGCPLPSIEALPMVDTGTWSRITNAQSANPRRLTHLADQYGIERKNAHVAGNDALVTLRVALAMAATGPNFEIASAGL